MQLNNKDVFCVLMGEIARIHISTTSPAHFLQSCPMTIYFDNNRRCNAKFEVNGALNSKHGNRSSLITNISRRRPGYRVLRILSILMMVSWKQGLIGLIVVWLFDRARSLFLASSTCVLFHLKTNFIFIWFFGVRHFFFCFSLCEGRGNDPE